MNNQELIEKIQGLDSSVTFEENQYLTIKVNASGLLALCKNLSLDKQMHFDYLINITGTDLGSVFRLSYLLTSSDFNHTLILHSDIERMDDAKIDSVVEVWKSANFHEREIYDLLGIHFNNHPDLRRIFLDEDWVGHPLRKDYKDEVNMIER